jgi:hypothetical protein
MTNPLIPKSQLDQKINELVDELHGGKITASQLWRILGSLQVSVYIWAFLFLFSAATAIFSLGRSFGGDGVSSTKKDASATGAKQEMPRDTFQGQSEIVPRIVVRDTPDSERPPRSVYDASKGEQKQAPDTTSPPLATYPADVTLFEYNAMAEDKSVPPLARDKKVQAYHDKVVDWFGYFKTAQLQTGDRPILVGIGHKPNGFAMWCRLPAKYESAVNALHEKEPIHFSGRISASNVVDATTIERVGTTPTDMQNYFERLRDPKQDSLKVIDEHTGKHVDWMGYFDSIDYIRDTNTQIRIVLTATKKSDYLYCTVSSDAKAVLPKMGPETMVHVAGILKNRDNLLLTAIAIVGDDKDWEGPNQKKPK